MALSTRPRSHAERDQIVSALSTFRAFSGADPTILALDDALFVAERAAYVEARENWQRRSAAAREASGVADQADADFDRDLRLFAASVRDEAGKATPRVVSELLGGTLPGTLTGLPYREEVQRTQGLFERISVRSGLSYDSDRAAALRVSTATLDAATAADEDATRAQTAAGSTLVEAKAAFDRAYMRLVAASRAILEDASFLSIFPRFVRQNPSDDEGGDKDEETEPTTSPA
jgi:hypothetical protein